MDELPAIIHKLSLRLWCPDQLPREENDYHKEKTDDEVAVDPFAAPPLDAVDANGHVLDANELSSLSLDGGSELHSLFSQKNLVRLSVLNDSHRTFSLFTPGIQNAMFRAWAGPMERMDPGRSTPLANSGLMRTQSVQGISTTYTFADTGSMENGSLPSRPSLVSLNSATTGLTLGAGRHPRISRKKKNRVVNLRRTKTGTASETTSEMGDTISETTSVAGPSSEPPMHTTILEEVEEEITQPHMSSSSRVRFKTGDEKDMPSRTPLNMDIYKDPAGPMEKEPTYSPARQEKAVENSASIPSKSPFNLDRKRANGSDTSSVILEQAWISKMAGEIARRVYDEKQKNANFWAERDDTPPPAYEATQ